MNTEVVLKIASLDEMRKAVEATYLKDSENRPVHVNRASSLGEECDRLLVYQRTNWRDAEPWDIGTLQRFAEGNVQEEAVKARLRLAGYSITKEQVPLWWEQYKISGHLDGFIEWEGRHRPLEIKSMSKHFFEQAVSELASGVVRNKWLRRYTAQVTIYCILSAEPDAVLVCKDRDGGDIAPFLVPLDMAYAEELTAKAERVNASVDLVTEARSKSLPEGGLYPAKLNRWSCLECRYRHICGPAPMPEEWTAGGKTWTTADIEEIETRKHELLEKKRGLKEVEEEVKRINATLAAILQASGGEIETPNWYVHGKDIPCAERVQKAYTYYGVWERKRGPQKAAEKARKKAAKDGADA